MELQRKRQEGGRKKNMKNKGGNVMTKKEDKIVDQSLYAKWKPQRESRKEQRNVGYDDTLTIGLK